MDKHNEPSDETLTQHYARRKVSHRSPVSIKHKLLAKQQDDKSISKTFSRISYVAVAASTLLLFGLIMLQQTNIHSPNLDYQTVQIHSLEMRDTLSSESIRRRYTEHYHNYLQQKNTYALHHKKQAKLYVHEGSWQLKTCDEKVLQLSQTLVQALDNMQKIDSQISSGDIVNIAFDQTGIILGIQRSANELHC